MNQPNATNIGLLSENLQDDEDIIKDFSRQLAQLLLDHALINIQKRKQEINCTNNSNACLEDP